jgi:hypothetical protein
MSLPLSTVVQISVAQPQPGLSAFAVNNLAIPTKETPINAVPAAGFYTYENSIAVAADWGTNSETYQQAVNFFDQTPNPLTGDGVLLVYAMASGNTLLVAAQALWGLTFFGGVVWAGYNPSVQEILALLAWTQGIYVQAGVPSNQLSDLSPAGTGATATATEAGGVITGVTPGSGGTGYTVPPTVVAGGGGTGFVGTATVVAGVVTGVVVNNGGTGYPPNPPISFISNNGLFSQISGLSLTFARMVIWPSASSLEAARIEMAAYMSTLMSTNFEGSNTTQTLQMKTLSNVAGDPGVTLSVLGQCAALGVDAYGIVQGLPKLYSYSQPGGASYADDMFNLEWLTYALQVALFNAIATTNTKIPQTEAGMAVLRDAVIGVLAQAVVNGYLAPGAWNATDKFGDPETFVRNIAANGYYVYSSPVALQSEVQREARVAPLIQIAIKLAGAIHSVPALIFINP